MTYCSLGRLQTRFIQEILQIKTILKMTSQKFIHRDSVLTNVKIFRNLNQLKEHVLWLEGMKLSINVEEK